MCQRLRAFGIGSKGREGAAKEALNIAEHASRDSLAPLKMRAGHVDLHHLTIAAKFARIGGRQLELWVHPARAGRCCGCRRGMLRAAAQPCRIVLGQRSLSKVQNRSLWARKRGTPFPFFFFKGRGVAGACGSFLWGRTPKGGD